MTTTLDDRLVADLASRASGPVITPGQDGYDEARAVHNGLIDRKPALIVRAQSTDDVVAALAFAREVGLEVSIRGGGHNVAGRAVTDGGVMISLADMRRVTVDPEGSTATAQGGATWADLNAAASEHGLAVTGGAHLDDRDRRLHARRWPRLADVQVRARGRQPRGRRARDGIRRGAPGRRRVAPGPVLGAARRWRQLRRGHLAHVPACTRSGRSRAG